jgi:hypothetical protein
MDAAMPIQAAADSFGRDSLRELLSRDPLSRAASPPLGQPAGSEPGGGGDGGEVGAGGSGSGKSDSGDLLARELLRRYPYDAAACVREVLAMTLEGGVVAASAAHRREALRIMSRLLEHRYAA